LHGGATIGLYHLFKGLKQRWVGMAVQEEQAHDSEFHFEIVQV
jgi:hypothetical protein